MIIYVCVDLIHNWSWILFSLLLHLFQFIEIDDNTQYVLSVYTPSHHSTLNRLHRKEVWWKHLLCILHFFFFLYSSQQHWNIRKQKGKKEACKIRICMIFFAIFSNFKWLFAINFCTQFLYIYTTSLYYCLITSSSNFNWILWLFRFFYV